MKGSGKKFHSVQDFFYFCFSLICGLFSSRWLSRVCDWLLLLLLYDSTRKSTLQIIWALTIVGSTIVGLTIVRSTIVVLTIVRLTMVWSTFEGLTIEWWICIWLSIVGSTIVGSTIVGSTIVGSTVVGSTIVGSIFEGSIFVGSTIVGSQIVGPTISYHWRYHRIDTIVGLEICIYWFWLPRCVVRLLLVMVCHTITPDFNRKLCLDLRLVTPGCKNMTICSLSTHQGSLNAIARRSSSVQILRKKIIR